jgi:hypothetical protein
MRNLRSLNFLINLWGCFISKYVDSSQDDFHTEGKSSENIDSGDLALLGFLESLPHSVIQVAIVPSIMKCGNESRIAVEEQMCKGGSDSYKVFVAEQTCFGGGVLHPAVGTEGPPSMVQLQSVGSAERLERKT